MGRISTGSDSLARYEQRPCSDLIRKDKNALSLSLAMQIRYSFPTPG
jgi:hypothetical protein